MTMSYKWSRSTQSHHLNKLVVLDYPMLYTKFQGHRALGSEEDFWRFLRYMGLEAILVMWPRTVEQIFIPTSHGGSIWNLASNGLVFLEEKRLENVESEWPLTKVNEWPWPWVVINHHILIYLTICTRIFTSQASIVSWESSFKHFPIQKQKGPNLTLL